MWRWSWKSRCARFLNGVFSTYVEVILSKFEGLKKVVCFLHVCGGDPTTGCQPNHQDRFSPRMWRWSYWCRISLLDHKVFSTYVEVILPAWTTDLIVSQFSPRMWRWSWYCRYTAPPQTVFSTYVEVILSIKTDFPRRVSFLHVCGGDPVKGNPERHAKRFSPRMWRWSSSVESRSPWNDVFSTYVEVILFSKNGVLIWYCFLHVCGGDPEWKALDYSRVRFSPRMWRWSSSNKHSFKLFSVFSTYVEVILIYGKWVSAEGRFLHVCGGDPLPSNLMSFISKFSPRMWRWS